MSIPLAEVRIGEPIRYGSLSVFPLFCDGQQPVEYVLADEAMEAGTVTVAEVSKEGSVPTLVVENQGDLRALFLEGEELRGAKQNRILNTTVLVPAQAKLNLPVSCVEMGRWRQTSDLFVSKKIISPYHLRHGLKRSVTLSLKENLGHRSDQQMVWSEVGKQQHVLAVESVTASMADTYDKYEAPLAAVKESVEYATGACGLAAAIGPRIVAADIFDKPATCEKVWSRLLSGLMLDSLMKGHTDGSPEPGQVAGLVDEIKSAPWTRTKAVGEGEEYRAEFGGKVGSALVLSGALVHGSVVASVS
jgi:hypothetical protein